MAELIIEPRFTFHAKRLLKLGCSEINSSTLDSERAWLMSFSHLGADRAAVIPWGSNDEEIFAAIDAALFDLCVPPQFHAGLGEANWREGCGIYADWLEQAGEPHDGWRALQHHGERLMLASGASLASTPWQRYWWETTKEVASHVTVAGGFGLQRHAIIHLATVLQYYWDNRDLYLALFYELSGHKCGEMVLQRHPGLCAVEFGPNVWIQPDTNQTEFSLRIDVAYTDNKVFIYRKGQRETWPLTCDKFFDVADVLTIHSADHERRELQAKLDHNEAVRESFCKLLDLPAIYSWEAIWEETRRLKRLTTDH